MMHVVFTRHQLTPKQLEEIGTVSLDLTDLASKNLSSLADAEEVFWQIARRIQSAATSVYTPVRIYGVIPTPLRHVLQNWSKHAPNARTVMVFEAFNVNRSKEGEKPSFEHEGWLQTGEYYFPV